ncbi:hypothetical protein [Methylobacterium indicum]|uniref:Uncharacterized protein n=1 Tax=Methylobacterium indicum TaxID=1775910 RepID=A0A8H8X161_9HYPH|nr:hypothetical protein [Methylobacterium indicum]BCM88099.1 hypothetical protein mvi_65600 [Methylobacterium indicum]
MSRLTSHPDNLPTDFAAIADAMTSASAYAETAARFAEIGDAAAVAFAVRSASACLLTAAELTDRIRPATRLRRGNAA